MHAFFCFTSVLAGAWGGCLRNSFFILALGSAGGNLYFLTYGRDLVKYSTLNGFDPRLCYGDITLHFVFKGEYTFKGSTEQDIEEIHDIMGLESSM
ncbi:hypothetical protein HPB48_003488 [Haemaphysalis longicornis]|uniref:Uncharacterized protein n=1 Tax=Haemaphysalis longicornis TaxID=44386 RepID=A0A9J6GG95_HAELO|nr:hypothetical protein HPB48_003488 [Haemaphysalis longicornis]